jgi:transposase
MNKKYIVELTSEERSKLQAMVRKGKAAAYRIKHAHILLTADQGPDGPGGKDADIAVTFHCHVTTVENIRRRFVEHGLDAAVERAKHKAYKPQKLDGRAEALLVATACSEAPAGRSKWTLRLLADRMVELKIVDSISYGTVRNVLKKTSSSLGEMNAGAFPQSKTRNS